MDDIDRKILRLLQDNARTSLKTIAENTFLSSPAVSARIEKLEKDGIISGYHAQVNPMKLGYHIIAFINLNVVPDDKPKFYAYAESVPNILECSCVTGDYSMILKVAFHSTMELDVFRSLERPVPRLYFLPMWDRAAWMYRRIKFHFCSFFIQYIRIV